MPKAVTPSAPRILRNPGPSPRSARLAADQPSPRRTLSVCGSLIVLPPVLSLSLERRGYRGRGGRRERAATLAFLFADRRIHVGEQRQVAVQTRVEAVAEGHRGV